ncbi:C40 family peptidase [Bifidobacterium tsurumiense]|nr:C40 family peptidase [Bifidobacterium tsurumiense]MSS12274.1 NlpC/P60 family protein [Bifidobacterium tsurumiense]
MKLTKSMSAIVAAVAASATLAALAPTASAGTDDGSVVTSSRSFPKVNTVKKNLLEESTSTSVDQDSNWGGIESLDVPQTQSQAEKDAEAAQKAAEEAAAAASRSSTRESTTTSTSTSYTVTPPDDASVSSLLNYAAQFVGNVPYLSGGTTPAGWDCSGFVQYVYASIGVSLPRTSGQQATVGQAVASLADAQPGDIIANGTHAAIYVGNGMVINSQLNGTKYDSVPVVFTSSYSIRRVL